MEELKNEVKKELTYQELQNVASQLSEQNQKLKHTIQEMNFTNILNRLTFLFKVVENAKVFSEKFSADCIKEIEDLMTLPENKKEETNVEQEG